MKPQFSTIRTHEDFNALLSATRAHVAALEAAEPEYPVWGLLGRQLDFAKTSTANGRTPTGEERAKFMVGTIAVRELEPAHDRRIYHLCQSLHALQRFFRVDY